MRVFCDTSVLVAGCIRQHPHHARSAGILADIIEKRVEGFCGAHSLGEAFSALTNMPLQPRVTPTEAEVLIRNNIQNSFKLVTARAGFYSKAIQACAAGGVLGGIVYDALLIECARSIRADRIYTLNRSHFLQLAPDLADRIMAP